MFLNFSDFLLVEAALYSHLYTHLFALSRLYLCKNSLGKMHFVRSVLEHHKNGGDADEIERAYQQLEKEAAENDSDEGDSAAMFDYG